MANPLGLPDSALLQRPSSLRELLLGSKPPHVVELLDGAAWGPLAGTRVGLRSLPAGPMTAAVGDAVTWCVDVPRLHREDLFSGMGEEALELESKVQILARALCHVDDPTQPFVDGPADVRDLFTPEQVGWLFDRFTAFQRTRSPYKVLADDAAIEELADALSKGYAPPTSLSSYDFATLRRISTALVARLTRPTTPSSSATR